MRVLVLGAAGRAGRAVVTSLLTFGKVERVFIADDNAEGLGKLVSDLGRMPVSPRFLEASNDRSLRERMAEADLVLGCLGPSHLYEVPVVRAAIDTGRDYISLCDDPDATAEALAMDGQARDKGVRIVCGCGLAPGLSNLLACRATSRLDAGSDIDLRWYLSLGNQTGTATVDHILKSMSGKAPLYRHGMARARSGGWEEYSEFPDPAGWQRVAVMAHPEPLTLPRTLDIGELSFKGGVGGRAYSLLFETLGWMDGEGDSELLRAVLKAAARTIARTRETSCLSAVKVTASGTSGGSERKVNLAACGDYYHASALVMLAAIGRWVRGEIPAGVHPPEAAFDDPAFFAALRRLGLRILITS
jgi:saccharopine dehydrogenase-like NADP-dependent oxidoreductase